MEDSEKSKTVNLLLQPPAQPPATGLCSGVSQGQPEVKLLGCPMVIKFNPDRSTMHCRSKGHTGSVRVNQR